MSFRAFIALIVCKFSVIYSIRIFPEKVIGAYGSWNECDDKMVRASEQGANVLLWFSINLISDPITGLPLITTGLDFDCVANVTKVLRQMNLSTVSIHACCYTLHENMYAVGVLVHGVHDTLPISHH